jgi:hypothetical protein
MTTTAILVTFIIVAALLNSLGSGRDGTILRRPYANRYNDASAAREDAVLETD